MVKEREVGSCFIITSFPCSFYKRIQYFCRLVTIPGQHKRLYSLNPFRYSDAPSTLFCSYSCYAITWQSNPLLKVRSKVDPFRFLKTYG